METAKGKVFKYGDNVDTDVIIPAKISERIQRRGAGKILHD